MCTSFAVWSYFRKKRVDGPFEIYTDSTDKIRYLAKLNCVFILGWLANIFTVIMNLVNLFQSNELPIPILLVIAFNFQMRGLTPPSLDGISF